MTSYKIGIIGGTGPQGKGLAYRFAQAGHTVVLGSRSTERAERTATEIVRRAGDAVSISGTDNATAAESADVVLLAVPYNGHAALVESLRTRLAGKVVLSCVNPLGFDQRGPYGLNVAEGSAAEEAQRIVPEARLVGAFHHLSATSLWSGGRAARPRGRTGLRRRQRGQDGRRRAGTHGHRPRRHRRRRTAAGPSTGAVHRRADRRQQALQGSLRYPHRRPRARRMTVGGDDRLPDAPALPVPNVPRPLIHPLPEVTRMPVPYRHLTASGARQA
ncbi:NADPH-dependent F420 reductase [Streptomyces viridosporus]|uniref:NADPH-dependent F420 reductase n=1 Tax=Streptomyces viridosporus TaxID=67581 RepID=UPI00332FAA69